MAKICGNSEENDKKLHSAASDPGLHCLPFTLLRVSRLQWVNNKSSYLAYTFCLTQTLFVVSDLDLHSL